MAGINKQLNKTQFVSFFVYRRQSRDRFRMRITRMYNVHNQIKDQCSLLNDQLSPTICHTRCLPLLTVQFILISITIMHIHSISVYYYGSRISFLQGPYRCNNSWSQSILLYIETRLVTCTSYQHNKLTIILRRLHVCNIMYCQIMSIFESTYIAVDIITKHFFLHCVPNVSPKLLQIT